MSLRMTEMLVAALALAAMTLPAVWPADAHGATMEFGNVLSGGGMLSKRVTSMRERRYANMVPQSTDFSCGAAAVATILKYAYGRDVTERDVIEGLLKVSDPEQVRIKGFSLLDIKHYLEGLGMRGRGYKIVPALLERIRIPTIALLDIKGYKHFVVIDRVTGEKAYIADPALGNRIIPLEQFLAEWNGMVFAVIGRGFDRNTVLLSPPPQLTSNGLVDHYRPMTDTELLEFGFSYADLF